VVDHFDLWLDESWNLKAMEKELRRSMRRRWMTWAITTALMALYVAVARIESQPTRGKLELKPGNEIELRVFRAFDETLSAGLNVVSAKCISGIGAWSSPQRTAWREVPDYWVFTPDTLIRLELSIENQKPLAFEAVPADRDCGQNFRRLTSNLSVAPGLYRRPPRNVQEIPLRRFVNNLRIRVAEVDPQIVGTTVDVVVLAPLGFKSTDPNLVFFWFAFFLEPVFWVTQSIWLLFLLARWRWSFLKKPG
jgi:hypothetical protein